MPFWHTLSLKQIEEEFKTSATKGITKEQSERLLAEFGSNQLAEEKSEPLISIFLRQFKSPLIYILVVSSIILFLLKEFIDAGIIVFVLVFNSVLGAIHEGRSQQTLRALKKYIQTTAVVVRDGEEMVLPDIHIVPGDLIVLREGDKIPADARVIESNGLRVDESSVTGESIPVDKETRALKDKKLQLPEQVNMLLKGTTVVAGNGKALVVATGLSTEIGKLSKKIEDIVTEMPLKVALDKLSRSIIILTVILCAGIFMLGIIVGKDMITMFETVVSLSVSLVPEGLPIVLTLILTTGVWRMAKKKALVKKLQAVEALGQARVIAVDKTGTITQNQLTVRKLFAGDTEYDVTGNGYASEGDILQDGEKISPTHSKDLSALITTSALLSNADVFFSEEKNEWNISGDPTEAALLVTARKFGLDPERLKKDQPRLAEIPFHYTQKFHAALLELKDKQTIGVIGAPETILARSSTYLRAGQTVQLTDGKKAELEERIALYSKNGYRVLCAGLTSHTKDVQFDDSRIRNLSFVGILCLQDTLRPEVSLAIKRAQQAGVRIVMMTGDHKLTATAIAREAGIYRDGDKVLLGEELESMKPEEITHALSNTTVFARVTPEHKMLIVQGYRSRGEIVAMTGDGVNDAPALVAADLGIAMGKTGTEVTKEASDIILLDDNLASIVAAIEEGRNITRTLKKILVYLFSTNLSEVFLIMLALFMGLPLPLTAAQIIWMNLVTDSFLDTGLAMEPKDPHLLDESYMKKKHTLIDGLIMRRIFLMSIPMALSALYVFMTTVTVDPAKAVTLSMTILVVSHWFNIFNCRSNIESLFRMNPFVNPFLIGAFVIVIALQMLAIYHPFFNAILTTTPLSGQDWLLVIGFSFPAVILEEVRKLFVRVSAHSSARSASVSLAEQT